MLDISVYIRERVKLVSENSFQFYKLLVMVQVDMMVRNFTHLPEHSNATLFVTWAILLPGVQSGAYEHPEAAQRNVQLVYSCSKGTSS